MDLELEEDVNQFHLETLTNIRRYCESQGIRTRIFNERPGH